MTIINKINPDGKIEHAAHYSCGIKEAMISYLEQTKNNNFKTSEYDRSRFWNELQLSSDGVGVEYHDEDSNTIIAKITLVQFGSNQCIA